MIRADILLIACIFPRPCGAWKNTTQLAKYPHVSYAKPSNKVYILSVEVFVIIIWNYQGPWFFWISQIQNPIIVLINIYLKKVTTNCHAFHTTLFILFLEIIHCTLRLEISYLNCRLHWFQKLTVGSQPIRRQILSTKLYCRDKDFYKNSLVHKKWFVRAMFCTTCHLTCIQRVLCRRDMLLWYVT